MERIVLGVILLAALGVTVRWILRWTRRAADLPTPACGACPFAARCARDATGQERCGSGGDGGSDAT